MYGLFQYYKDELTGWNRTIVQCKGELGELVRKITVGEDQQIISASIKESDNFVDLLMEEEQKFDHLLNLVAGQLQRLERWLSDKPIEPPISRQQDLLRTRMHAIEKNFIHTKYGCSIFLSSFFQKQVVASRRLNVLKGIKFNYGKLPLQ
jgi:hypothetical protein